MQSTNIKIEGKIQFDDTFFFSHVAPKLFFKCSNFNNFLLLLLKSDNFMVVTLFLFNFIYLFI